jgi:hypothetical protein
LDDDRGIFQQGGLHADSVGRLFGKKSRSEFLNILGRMIGGTVGLAQSIKTTLIPAIRSLFTTFSEAGGGGAGLIAVFGRLGAGAAAAAPAVLLLISVLSAFASMLGALGGIVTGLSSTIASGLTGGLLVLGGTLAAVTTSVTLLTIAFTNMTEAQQKVFAANFLPFREALAGIGQLMITQIIPSFATWSNNLQQALLRMAPLAQVMGQAFAQAGNTITAAFSGPGFQNFFRVMTQNLPGITKNLATSFSGFANGLAGVFSALTPAVVRFSRYLADVATRFATWANSARGQNAIKDFVERASTSLRALGRAIRQVGGFLKDVLFNPAVQNAGNRMFNSIAKTFEKFRAAVARASKNGDLQRWMNDAIKFGSALWSVMEALWAIFVALYNSGVLGAVAGGLRVVASAAKVLADAVAPLIDLLGKLAAALSRLPQLAGLIGGLAGGPGGSALTTLLSNGLGGGGGGTPIVRGPFGDERRQPSGGGFSLDFLRSLGGGAVGGGGGGGGGDTATEAPWVNPYKKWAESLIKEGPSTKALMRKALKKLATETVAAIQEVSRTNDPGGVNDALQQLVANLKTAGREARDSAREALNSAASELAGATDPAAAASALKAVKKAQGDL